ncbi:MAG: hypothetical protein PHY74_06365 [Candidatus Bathyarchaeota archaeon]|nr:hypothetical protein [Candidatus Bathyarchaeota archaeon]
MVAEPRKYDYKEGKDKNAKPTATQQEACTESVCFIINCKT